EMPPRIRCAGVWTSSRDASFGCEVPRSARNDVVGNTSSFAEFTRGLALKNIVQQPSEVSGIVEHLFRHEGAKMVAILTRIFGIEHLNLAEDVVQEALSRALQTWPYRGVPENPSAWIMRASRNLALDVIRRQKSFRAKEGEIARLIERDG